MTTGKGYSYWDNLNALCDRLWLLLTSHDTDHTRHTNEISSIVEELRVAGSIKGLGNRKIHSLIQLVSISSDVTSTAIVRLTPPLLLEV